MKTRVNYFLKSLLKETKTMGEVSDPGLKRWNNFIHRILWTLKVCCIVTTIFLIENSGTLTR